jgi:hypothetical protein
MGNDGRSNKKRKQVGDGQSPLATTRSNYEVEQATMPFIDDVDNAYDIGLPDNCKPATRLSQVRLISMNALLKKS